VRYYRFAKGDHSQSDSEYWTSIVPDVKGYKEMDHPAIAAVGTEPTVKVYLAWDNQRDPTTTIYSLVGVESTDSGGSWGGVNHITSTNPADTTLDAGDEKRGLDGATPPIEDGLRPSLAITDSNKFAVVWQEQPEECGVGGEGLGIQDVSNGTSEVFFASDTGNSWTTAGMLANNRFEYSIDPDIAVDGNGTHIVFMKASDSGSCPSGGGGSGEYTVYYRGPITSFSSSGSRVYLPIIIKNS
jgi:hypothetical protein